MFWKTMKRQFIYFSIFTCGFGASNIVESVISFDIVRLLVNVFMVLTLAFVLFAASYPLVRIYKKLTSLLLLLTCVAVFTGLPVAEADANIKEGLKRFGRKALVFVATVVGYDKADDAYDAIENELVSYSHYAVDYVVEAFTTAVCSRCGVRYELPLDSISDLFWRDSSHQNCIALP